MTHLLLTWATPDQWRGVAGILFGLLGGLVIGEGRVIKWRDRVRHLETLPGYSQWILEQQSKEKV